HGSAPLCAQYRTRRHLVAGDGDGEVDGRTRSRDPGSTVRGWRSILSLYDVEDLLQALTPPTPAIIDPAPRILGCDARRRSCRLHRGHPLVPDRLVVSHRIRHRTAMNRGLPPAFLSFIA